MAQGATKELFTSDLDNLLRAYAAHDERGPAQEALRGQIVARLLPYVKSIAHGLARRSSDPVEDLIQVGTIGLMKAADRFNPSAGSSFKTYATYFITGEIRHYLRDKVSMIKAPRQVYELYYRMNQIVQQLSERLGRPPTDLEIAEALQCPLEHVEQAQAVDRRRQVYSLDEFLVNETGEESVHVERLVDDSYHQVTQNHETRILLDQAMGELQDELRRVIDMTYYDDLSQAEIAKRLGISQMQVSRRLRKALDILAKHVGEN